MKSHKEIKLSNNDCVISVRCKSTTLATLLKYRHQEGTALGLAQGTLIRDAMEALVDQILSLDPSLRFESITLAREYLELKGFTKLNTGDKGGFTAFRKLRDEANLGKDDHLKSQDISDEELLNIAQSDPEVERIRRQFQKK